MNTNSQTNIEGDANNYIINSTICNHAELKKLNIIYESKIKSSFLLDASEYQTLVFRILDAGDYWLIASYGYINKNSSGYECVLTYCESSDLNQAISIADAYADSSYQDSLAHNTKLDGCLHCNNVTSQLFNGMCTDCCL